MAWEIQASITEDHSNRRISGHMRSPYACMVMHAISMFICKTLHRLERKFEYQACVLARRENLKSNFLTTRDCILCLVPHVVTTQLHSQRMHRDSFTFPSKKMLKDVAKMLQAKGRQTSTHFGKHKLKNCHTACSTIP